MAVLLSPYGGVGAQFLDNSGNVLTGGKIFTYAAGTTTNQVTFTNSAGTVAHSNPIILDASGRVPSGEIWLTDGLSYKFVLKDSNDVLIATYDNIIGINSNFVNFSNQQEIQTATAGQTVFTLTTMAYQPGTNSLSVFVDGVNQYGPGAMYAYVETDSTTITFTSGLHVGAEVKFTTSNIVSSAGGDAFNVGYLPPFTGSVGTNVGDKLAEIVSVKDFGAVGDGITDDSIAINNAIVYVNSIGGGTVYMPEGTYLVSAAAGTSTAVYILANVYLQGAGVNATTIRLANATDLSTVGFEFDTNGQMITDMTIDGNRANQTAGVHCLRFHGNANTYTARLICKEGRAYGLGVGYTVATQLPFRDSIVEDIEIYNIGAAGFGDAFDGKRTERCTIRRIYAHDIVANGLDIRGNHTVIQDVYVKDVGGVGFSQRMSAYLDPNGNFRQSRHLYAENITCENCGSHGFWMEAVPGDLPWFTNDWFGRAFLVNATARNCAFNGFYLGGDRIYGSLVNCLAEDSGIHGFTLNVDNNVDVHYKLSNCTAKNSVQRGFNSATTAADGFVFSSCEAVDNGTEGFYSLANKTVMAGCKAQTSNALYRSFFIAGNDCILTGFSSTAVASATNVRVDGARNVVSNGTLSGAGTGLQTAVAASNTVFSSISVENVSGPKVNDAGTNTRMTNILGYTTKNSGTAQITSGNTFVDVTHGLASTPAAADVFLTPQSSLGSSNTFWVSNRGSTTFRINVNVNPATTITFAWSAAIKQD